MTFRRTVTLCDRWMCLCNPQHLKQNYIVKCCYVFIYGVHTLAVSALKLLITYLVTGEIQREIRESVCV
jgi:hypothetical protein